MHDDRLSEIAESAEAENLFLLLDGAPASVKATLGMASARVGGGVLLAMRDDPVGGFWNKALGFGFAEPVTGDLIADVCDFFREQKSPGANLQFAPSVLPPDWERICAANGLTAGTQWVKLACPVEDFQSGTSDLRISAVDSRQASEAASLLMDVFGMPQGALTDMFVSVARHDQVQAFAAWDGDDMVAAGYVSFLGQAAAFSGGATLPAYRNRGAQSALLAARARAAAEAGCRWLISETALPDEGSANPSLNNMLRAGFKPLYERRNWLWSPDQAAA
ncbi:GNAT family N-acetyltransferase [Nonomuraea lactucae]|uniref:GNAT family N-acetyltransferase n=1 Tax=Nonomuraea lactucae TaxID=2249762 RepID=UPI000DE4B7E3|nr:GNAT family N-acetyltransferase [Nonomuraea lactucae]